MAHSLYIHIPFCLKRCMYCDFVSGIYDPDRAAAYTEALKKEISHIPDKTVFSTLYIGGGTPTALATATIVNLIGDIFRRFTFTDGYEATMEANPGTLDREKVSALDNAGINRLSLGVQSFNDRELRFLGRTHTSMEAENAFRTCRKAGFENIGMDLIYGVPGQTIESWKETLEKTAILEPRHISTYELTVETGTPLHSLTGLDKLPEEEIIDMYELAMDYLRSQGYVHYEIANFAKPAYSCQHNINYWDQGEYYGAGLGAHSCLGNKRFRNTDNLEEYLDAVENGRRPVASSESIDEQTRIAEAVFLGLRKTEGIYPHTLSERFGRNVLDYYREEIKELKEAELLETAGAALRLTRKGILLSNEVFEKFLKVT